MLVLNELYFEDVGAAPAAGCKYAFSSSEACPELAALCNEIRSNGDALMKV